MKKLLVVLGLIIMCAGSAYAYSTPRWSSFPLNIYIQPNSNSAPVVQNAFKSWQANSGSLLRFIFRQGNVAANTSQISVYFTDKPIDNKYYTIQRTNYNQYAAKGFFVHLNITISTKEADGKNISSNKLKAIALRAVGDAMGIRCIPSSGEDIMSCATKYDHTSVTENDKKALNSVYKYDKEINFYNKNLKKKTTKK